MDQETRTKLETKFTQLNKDFRQMPMYQFFREIGPLEGFAVLQTQAGVVNINTQIMGVFLFQDEAEAAQKFLKEKNTHLSYEVKPTKITRYKGY